MKEKIKSFMLHFLIIYVIFIIICSVVKLINYPSTIELEDTDENIAKYTQLKEEANLILTDSTCHTSIKEIIDFYEETSYSGIVKLNEMDYENAVTPISIGFKLKTNCSEYEDRINEEDIYGKVLASTSLYEEVFFQSILFNYEISIRDIFTRYIYGSNLVSLEYNSERKLELEIIEELLEIVKESEIYEE